VVSATAVAALVCALAFGPSGRLPSSAIPMLAFALGFGPVGWALVRHLGLRAIAITVFSTGLAALLWLVAWAGSGWTVGAWALQWLGLVPWGLLVVVLLTFPEFAPTGLRRWLTWLTYGVLALACSALAVAALAAPRTLVTAPEVATPESVAGLVRLGALAGFGLVALAIVAIVLLVAAARAAEPSARWAYAALLPAAVLFPTGVAFDIAGMDDATVVGIVAVPLGIGVAILQSAWQDLDVLIDRRLVAAGVWVIVFSLLALVLLGLAPLAARVAPPVAALAVAALVIGLSGIRRVLLGAANRWLFGGVDDPFALVRTIGERMDASLDPLETLRRSPAALAQALRLPYAAIVLAQESGESVVAEHGRRLVAPTSVPLVAGGVALGRFEVSPRAHGEALSAMEIRLIETVAQHAARVAESYVLSLDVQRAREGLVLAREEERLRLRHDLHDGLGPLLAGARMQLAAASRVGDVARQGELLRGAADDLGTATASVRELVDGLRPAALGEGLVSAISAAAVGLLPDLAVTVAAPEELPELSPAVEIAAYRIVAEALTNVARHARGATACRVAVVVGTDLRIVVEDDGHGIPNPRAGVGTASMRARAEELGGRVEVRFGEDGAQVVVALPLAGGRDDVPTAQVRAV